MVRVLMRKNGFIALNLIYLAVLLAPFICGTKIKLIAYLEVIHLDFFLFSSKWTNNR